jgi:hypothetical protein
MTPPPEIKSKYTNVSKQKTGEEKNKTLPVDNQPSKDKTDKTQAVVSISNNLPLIKPQFGRKNEPPSAANGRAARVLNVGNDKDKDAILDRYRYMVRSPTVGEEKVYNYLVLCIRGLHYSTQCLKEPSKKFLNSRKLKLEDPPSGILV